MTSASPGISSRAASIWADSSVPLTKDVGTSASFQRTWEWATKSVPVRWSVTVADPSTMLSGLADRRTGLGLELVDESLLQATPRTKRPSNDVAAQRQKVSEEAR